MPNSEVVRASASRCPASEPTNARTTPHETVPTTRAAKVQPAGERAHRASRGDTAMTGANETIPVWCAVSASGTRRTAIASGATVSRSTKRIAQAATPVARRAVTGSGRIVMSQARARRETRSQEPTSAQDPTAGGDAAVTLPKVHRQEHPRHHEGHECSGTAGRGRRSSARPPSDGATRPSSRAGD